MGFGGTLYWWVGRRKMEAPEKLLPFRTFPNEARGITMSLCPPPSFANWTIKTGGQEVVGTEMTIIK